MAIFEILLGNTMMLAARLGPWLLALLLIVAFFLGRWLQKRRVVARAPWQIPAMVLVTVVEIFAITSLVMTFGPGKGIVSEMRQLHAKVGEEVAGVGLRSVEDDGETSLASLHGKVVLLNIWATWCPPCRVEMPELGQVQEQLQARGLVVATLSDEEREVLTNYFSEYPTAGSHFYGDLAALALPTGMRPTTLLIDRQGRLHDFVIGARDADYFRDWVEPLLDNDSG